MHKHRWGASVSSPKYREAGRSRAGASFYSKKSINIITVEQIEKARTATACLQRHYGIRTTQLDQYNFDSY